MNQEKAKQWQGKIENKYYRKCYHLKEQIFNYIVSYWGLKKEIHL